MDGGDVVEVSIVGSVSLVVGGTELERGGGSVVCGGDVKVEDAEGEEEPGTVVEAAEEDEPGTVVEAAVEELVEEEEEGGGALVVVVDVTLSVNSSSVTEHPGTVNTYGLDEATVAGGGAGTALDAVSVELETPLKK